MGEVKMSYKLAFLFTVVVWLVVVLVMWDIDDKMLVPVRKVTQDCCKEHAQKIEELSKELDGWEHHVLTQDEDIWKLKQEIKAFLEKKAK
jgi:hypothetical protein